MDFHFPNNQPLTWSGPAEKAKGNVAAIQLVRKLEAENRPATPEELTSLSRYVGWGHSQVMNYALKNLGLESTLDENEWEAVKASTLNAHYTAIPVIAAIWRGLERLGAGKLSRIQVLDPSAGIGHFKSATPPDLREKCGWTEVELDPITASILGGLHPESKVFATGYEDVNLPKGFFDVAISNVPFGNYPVIFDGLPRHLCTSIHDFFFARSLDLLRPGGVMAFITSRYTLDKKDDKVREYLAEHSDLLAAVRLPNNAFMANAGTEVVTDLLFLRKHHHKNKVMPDWANVGGLTLRHHERDWAEQAFWVNRYFLDHPQNILGKPAASGTMYRNYEYTVLPDERDLGAAITATLKACLPEDLLTLEAPQIQFAGVTLPEIQAEADPAPVAEPARVTAMRELYQMARELLQKEIGQQSVTHLRHNLNARYDEFVARYGFLNDPANTRPLKGTPELLFLKALEVQGPGTWLKADMFSKTTVRQAHPLEKTDNPNDALLLCLDKLGRVDIPTISEITGSPEEDVIRHLAGGRIFRDPETRQWLTDDAYLSGNVAAKLETAEAAAIFDDAYQINVTALQMVQPEPLKPENIYAPLGAGWIPESDIEQFLRELLETSAVSASYSAYSAAWSISIDSWLSKGISSRWSTERVDCDSIISDTLNAKQMVVYDTIYLPDGKETRRINHEATIAAQARKAAAEAESSEDDETEAEMLLTTDIYAQIKRRLVRRGIPQAEIAFAHDAKSSEQKTALYKALNEGRKRVVIASTEKMGVGVNVQERLLAVHHLTPTWRPDGLRQRTGRMERPGNRYSQVFEFVYVTPGSFDGYMWQLLEAKLGFIKDMERGTVQREADDIGDDAVSYAAIKAMSSGNPKLLKKVELDSQILKLEALRREWLSARSSMLHSKDWREKRQPQLEAECRELEAAIAERDAAEKKGFSVVISEAAFTEREAAGKALRRAARMERETAQVGLYRGLPLVGALKLSLSGGELLPDLLVGLKLPDGKILAANNETTDKGLFASIDAILRSLDEKLAIARQAVENARIDLASIETESAKPWPHEAEFSALASQLAALNAELAQATREKQDGEEGDIDLSIVDNDDAWLAAYQAALARIEAIHQYLIPVHLPETAIPVTPESIAQVRAEIARNQAQLDFMQAVASTPPTQPLAAQLSMFGEAVPVKAERRKRR